MTGPALDEDAVTACADLARRSGARSFQIGFGVDPPHHWFAHAQYKGARVTVEDQPGPAEAADALARRLLTGAKCTGCGGLVTLTSGGAVAYPGEPFTDGTTTTEGQARQMRQCRWTRMGARWEMGCRR